MNSKDLIEKSTAPLRDDPELQLAVATELRSHIAVYRAAFLCGHFGWAKWKSDAEEKEYLLTQLRRCRTLEPDNALYSYLLANIALEDAVKLHRADAEQPTRLEVIDPASFERGMSEIAIGLRQSGFRMYLSESAKERMGPRPKLMDFPTAMHDLGVTFNTLLPWTPY